MRQANDDPHPASAEAAALGASELARLLERGETTSREVTERLVERVEAVDWAGPELRSVIELAPDALEQAAALDAERAAGRVRGVLHGLPVIVKDNIDTAAPLHTTAGSFVFGDHSPSDAPLVAALRAAGALVLGKANLSEWANFRGRPSASGWSAVGGQTRNPHVLDRTPGGSSAGSAAAVAAGLAPLAVGTETDGSILCPSAACGVSGLKPTVGLVSRTGIVPIAPSQDTAGPMARRVEDLALLLGVLAGAPEDPAHPAIPPGRPAGVEHHFRALLGDGGLAGVRVGVLEAGGYAGYHPPTDRLVGEAVAALASTGAEIVQGIELGAGPLVLGADEHVVLTHEFRTSTAAYFERRAAGEAASGLPLSLEEVIAHARSDTRERTDLFGLELLEESAATAGSDSDRYPAALAALRAAARGNGLDRLFATHRLDAIVVAAMPPAWLIDHVLGDDYLGAGWSPPAVAGYPSATVPIGRIAGLPVGLALWGPPWSEAGLLRIAFALERALGPERTEPRPGYLASTSLLD